MSDKIREAFEKWYDSDFTELSISYKERSYQSWQAALATRPDVNQELGEVPERIWGGELKDGDILSLRDGAPLRMLRGLQGAYLTDIETNQPFRADVWDKIWDESGKHREHHEFDIMGVYNGLEAVKIERDWFKTRLSQVKELNPKAKDANAELVETLEDIEIFAENANKYDYDSITAITAISFIETACSQALAKHKAGGMKSYVDKASANGDYSAEVTVSQDGNGAIHIHDIKITEPAKAGAGFTEEELVNIADNVLDKPLDAYNVIIALKQAGALNVKEE